MRILQTWALIVTGVTIVGASAWAGDGNTKGVKRRPAPAWKRATVWDAMGRLIDDDDADKKAADKKVADKKPGDKKPDAKAKPETGKPLSKLAITTDPAEVQDREEAAFLRRSAACLKLQEIAVRTNDPELLRAEQLSERAWNNFSQRAVEAKAGLTDEDDMNVEKNPAKNGKSGSKTKESKP